MALFSPQTHLPTLSPSSSYSKPHLNLNLNLNLKPYLFLRPRSPLFYPKASTDNGSGSLGLAATAVEPKIEDTKVPETSEVVLEKPESSAGSNGSTTLAFEPELKEVVIKFDNPKWVNGTWDLNKFNKNGKTDWDAVIDAEARRRKWLEVNPESSNNDDPVLFDTSVVPWWAWVKRFHLPEAELLNGRAAMIGFFMAYFVDSLTGVGLVNQMSNFFCKTLLFISVAGVLVIRKNEDIETLKKLLEETTFYDKQWKATWKDDTSSSNSKDD